MIQLQQQPLTGIQLSNHVWSILICMFQNIVIVVVALMWSVSLSYDRNMNPTGGAADRLGAPPGWVTGTCSAGRCVPRFAV